MKNSCFRKTLVLLSILIAFLKPFTIYGQECNYSVEFQLNNIRGGVFSGQKITLKSTTDGTSFTLDSNALGNAIFKVPCNSVFNVTISNYTKKIEIKTLENGSSKQILSYDANMVAKDKLFAMNDLEINEVNLSAQQFPDTIFISGSKMSEPENVERCVMTSITLKDIEGKPLTNEILVITGVNRRKSIKVATDYNGKISVFLVKGDTYTLNFKYNKNYSSYDFPFRKGLSNSEMVLTYPGTKEIEKRRKAEALRIMEEEKRLKEEKELIVKECRRLKITLEEWYRKDLMKSLEGTTDTVISTVLNRNMWPNKLIVCDLTGSMRPYTTQLSVWYQLNLKKEQNLQFVFFNDGNNAPDDKKIIGATGGIYYTPSKGSDSLTALIAHVSACGDGGDCAENNMEALIKGVKMAKPYKELIAIVDNNSPVKDIELLKEFNLPVHILLCGASHGWVLSDYLLIAWKTKGSIHTIEQDITSIAKMSEGEEIKIGNITYRIMGGEFVRISRT